MVRRHLAGSVGGSDQHVRSRIKMRCTRSLDRLGLPFPVRALNLIANNSRFLILPDGHRPNVGSRVLSLVERRITGDWLARFGHPLFLLETFVDPRRFYGGVYRAANWLELGLTQGYRRTHQGYSDTADAPKRVFIRPLYHDTRARLTHPDYQQLQLTGDPNIMLSAEQMRMIY